jgi:sigma-B regulation protein RsbU (phosphoserine phosphatase)
MHQDFKENLPKCRERLEQLETCFRINSLLNSQLELDKLLDIIMQSAKQVAKADACSLLLLDSETGDLNIHIALSAVGEKLKEVGKIKQLKVGQGIAGAVAQTGKTIIVKDAYEHPNFNPSYDKETGFKTGAILCSPLTVKGEVIGVCQVIHHRDSKKVFTESDQTLFQMFCESSALAVRNSRSHQAIINMKRMERDMELSRSVQESFLPSQVPIVPGYAFGAKTLPAREVGGDYFDFIPFSDDKLGIIVGDVSGKGVPAALLMARLMSDFRYISQKNPNPGPTLEAVNKALCENAKGGMFTTAVYLLLDLKKKTLKVANAGHPSLIYKNSENKLEEKCPAGGPPLGILPSAKYPEEEIRVYKGDRILLYTDGAVEPKDNQNNQFGLDRLYDILLKETGPLEDLIALIHEEINDFVGDASQFDDLTILTFDVL